MSGCARTLKSAKVDLTQVVWLFTAKRGQLKGLPAKGATTRIAGARTNINNFIEDKSHVLNIRRSPVISVILAFTARAILELPSAAAVEDQTLRQDP